MSNIGSNNDHDVHEKQDDGEDNIFRDTPIRYLGYANELGESFRYQLPKFLVPSYVVAFGYCAVDALSTGYKVHSEKKEESSGIQNRRNAINFVPLSSEVNNQGDSFLKPEQSAALIATCDTLLWQCLASVMIPGATINAVVRLSRFAVASRAKPVSTWFPTAAGLSSIPFIVHPIDNAVDFFLDNTTRKWINEKEISK